MDKVRAKMLKPKAKTLLVYIILSISAFKDVKEAVIQGCSNKQKNFIMTFRGGLHDSKIKFYPAILKTLLCKQVSVT